MPYAPTGLARQPDRRTTSRREFVAVLAGSAAASFAGCSQPTTPFDKAPGGGPARLAARVSPPTESITPGSWPITPGVPNDGSLIVPSGYDPALPAPLVIALHGSGLGPDSSVAQLGGLAEARGFLLLACGSRGLTWDVFSYKYSYDIAFIDSALTWAFARCNVDAARVMVAGFSAGSMYGIAVAVANGDLFSRAIAFSPGWIPWSDSPAVGQPQFFVAHGTQDAIYPIDNASRKIVPDLRHRGYDVTYEEFSGGHEVPASIATHAMDWALV